MDFNQVLPTVYVGSCPQTTYDIDRLDRELGVTGVLNLQTDDDYENLGCDWGALASHYAGKGIEVRRVPIGDFDSQDLCLQLPLAVRALDDLLRDGRFVYVHCTQGVGRAPSVVVAYLHWIVQLDLNEAAEHLLHCRRCVPDVDAVYDATRKSSPRRQR
jgi:protein-tyrosine phosphatase